MDFIKAKKCVLNRAKELGACSDEYKKVLKSENYDELKQVINDNLSWCHRENLLSDQQSMEHFGVSFLNLLNSGNDNTGYGNSGYGNSGYGNSGSRNSGSRNSGYGNSGYGNSGYGNSGSRNSGSRNSGYGNSGYGNSGYGNSGDWNSGSRNSGYGNSGSRNSGDWNSGYGNNGFFNSVVPDTILVFNKPCKKKEWDDAEKPEFIFNIETTKWIWFSGMTDEEKKIHVKAYVCDGYLKVFTYKEAWKNAFDSASERDISLLKALPNFDPKVFEEITGIKLY